MDRKNEQNTARENEPENRQDDAAVQDEAAVKNAGSADKSKMKKEIPTGPDGITAKQVSLSAEGEVFFQPDPTNPLPGAAIGRVKKGESLLKPDIDPASSLPAGVDADKARAVLHFHIAQTLEPLSALDEQQDKEDIQSSARAIANKMHDALGILPRAALEDIIAGLDEEGRRALRARKIRLGPVLVFMPPLNKPAAIKLRALLWNVWHGNALPASVPPDGVTSISVAEQDDIDHVYYRAIGYPVYGPRAIRVDMLDRLITAVYDSAEKGIFKAQHEMAEWLGCPIPDLYAVLEAMDHKKLHDPAEEQRAAEEAAEQEKAAAATDEESTEKSDVTDDVKSAAEPVEEKVAATDEAETAAEEKAAQEKPELATFRLRKGKAYGRPPHKGGQAGGFKKPAGQDAKKGGYKGDKHKKGKFHKGKSPKGKPQRERVISTGPEKKPENSPFAVLKDFKVDKKD